MSTPIKAAIEALTDIKQMASTGKQAEYIIVKAADAIAALQAAQPVQSIDTPDQRALFDTAREQGYFRPATD